jgi:hypothetical protein
VAIMSLDQPTGNLVERTCWLRQERATEPHIAGPRAGIDEALGIPLSTPHTHSALFDSTGSWLFVGDVGNDRVTVYSFDQSAGSITKQSAAAHQIACCPFDVMARLAAGWSQAPGAKRGRERPVRERGGRVQGACLCMGQ